MSGWPKLGVRRLEDLIGRTDLLEILEGQTAKQQHLDLTPSCSGSDHVPADKPQFCDVDRQPAVRQGVLAETNVVDDGRRRAINDARAAPSSTSKCCNCDRSIGARISGEIARRTASQGMAKAPITSASTARPARASACGTPAA